MFDSSNPHHPAGKNKYRMKYTAHLFQICDSTYVTLGPCKITSVPYHQKSLGWSMFKVSMLTSRLVQLAVWIEAPARVFCVFSYTPATVCVAHVGNQKLPLIIPQQSTAATLVNYIFYHARDSFVMVLASPRACARAAVTGERGLCTHTRVLVHISPHAQAWHNSRMTNFF